MNHKFKVGDKVRCSHVELSKPIYTITFVNQVQQTIKVKEIFIDRVINHPIGTDLWMGAFVLVERKTGLPKWF